MKKLQQCKYPQPFYRCRIHGKLRPALLRLLLITTLLMYAVVKGYSQKMTGLWKGNYESGVIKYPIYLNFLLNADSTYTIHSYSWTTKPDGSDTVCIANVMYKFLGQDSLYLEEEYFILPQSPVQSCLQKMYLRLKVKKNDLELSGTWKITDTNCVGSGYLFFRKKR
jgi:hypothetical protein